MTKNERAPHQFAPSGYLLAPIQMHGPEGPLGVCVLVGTEENSPTGPFVLLRELPGSRVYLGAVLDAEARIQEWVEVWVQTTDLRDLAMASEREPLANYAFDQRWTAEYEMQKTNLPQNVFVTGMERKNPKPVLIKKQASTNLPGLAL